MSNYPYSYDDLLYRLHVSKTGDELYKKANLPPLKVTKKNRLSIISNYGAYCDRLCRSKEHVGHYFKTESGSNISINSQNQLIIQGILSEAKCDSIMKNYIRQYVMCKQCKGIDSVIIKENGLTFLQCHQCNAKTSLEKMSCYGGYGWGFPGGACGYGYGYRYGYGFGGGCGPYYGGCGPYYGGCGPYYGGWGGWRGGCC